MSAELLALAERCEAATGPDRELDALIAYQHLGLFVRNEGHPLGRKCYDTHGIEVALPRYTASLDAAMTLVPEGRRQDHVWPDGEGGFCSYIWEKDRAAYISGKSRACSTALALTAAALRARASSQNGGAA